MENFLKKIVEGDKFELVIDVNIFPKDIILKAAYNFLDKGYFFFKYLENGNILLQFSERQEKKMNPEDIIALFSDELISVYLRDKLEKDNKTIRERIVTMAITNSLDQKNFVSIDTDNLGSNQIDFDKDIYEILKELENDPELQIDEEEIAKILKEIEEEGINGKEDISLDINGLENAKKKFSDR